MENTPTRRLAARRTLLVLSTALCTGLAAPAFAASPHPNLDGNGVDLTDGSFNLRLPIASIGSGQAELALIAYSGTTDNWSQLTSTQQTIGSNSTISIGLGQEFDTFSASNGYATSIRGTGATLTINADGSITYRTPDGLVIVYGDPTGSGSTNRFALSVSGRSGMTVNLDWTTHGNCSTPSMPDEVPVCTYSLRLGGVHNNAGYAITFDYATSSVTFHQNPGPDWYRRTTATLSNTNVPGPVQTVVYGQPSANVFTITTPGGKIWRISGSGQTITAIKRPTAAADTTSIAYVSLGIVSAVTNNGVTTNYNRSVVGNTATETITDAQSQVTTVVSDMSQFRPTSVTDPLGRATTMTYDAIGRLTERSYPEGNKVQYGYDARGNLIETRLNAKPSVGGTDIVTTAGYPATCTDASCNNPLWTKDAKGNQTDYGYDSATGLVTSVTAPAAAPGANRPETRVAYSDVAGTKVATSISSCQTGAAPSCVGSADEVKQTIAYDLNLNATSTTVAAGDGSLSATTAQTYDALGNGQLQTIADAKANLTSYDYDGFDRLVKTRYPVATVGANSSSASDYDGVSYDANGNVTQRHQRDGQLIGYTFDALNRVTAKDVPNTVYAEYDVSYSYDLLGRLTQATNSVGHPVALSYDALGRVLSDNNPFYGKSLQYDLAGRLTRLTWADGNYIAYDHLITGEVSAVRENGATTGVGVLASYGYDGLGRRTSLTRGNGAVSTWSYDPASRLASLTHDLGGTANDVTTTFSYNPAGQIAAQNRSNDVYAWTGHYDVKRPYTVNGLNQLTSAGTTALGYDGRGNLTKSGSDSYTYTSENRLATAPATQLYYDALGRLLWSTVGTRFDETGDHITAELNGSTNAVERRFVWGPGADEPLVQYDGAGLTNRSWPIQDERGSVIAMTDASGNATAINRYDEYGIPAATNVGRFQYTGQAWLPELGMSYYKARMYSPTLGPFMQTDPIGYADGMNWYAYVGNDPVNWVDPSGLGSVCNADGSGCVDDGYGDIIVNAKLPNKPDAGGDASRFFNWIFGGGNGVGAPDGGGGASSGPRKPLQPPCNQDLVNAGNALADLSNASGTASNALTLAGLAGIGLGVVTLQPEVAGAGLAGVATGGALGLVSGVSEVASGLFQGLGGAGYSNAVNGSVGLSAGAAVGRLAGGRVPSGYRTVSQRAADNGAKNVGIITGGMFSAATAAIPSLGAQLKTCPR